MPETINRSWTVEEIIREGLDPRRYEIVLGELVERRDLGMEGARIKARLVGFLFAFFESHPIGVALDDQRFRFPGESRLERIPDVSVLRVERLHHPMPDIIASPPDIAIEVVSPTDEEADVAAKAQEYLQRGTREVWVVRPSFEIVTVHRPDESPLALDKRDVLESAILPGLSLPLARLFAPLPTSPKPAS